MRRVLAFLNGGMAALLLLASLALAAWSLSLAAMRWGPIPIIAFLVFLVGGLLGVAYE
jgi:hypothetical protein